MHDLISRKAALRTDYFGDGHEGLRAFHSYHDYRLMREYLESLPSIDAVEVVRCKDCINYTRVKDEWGSCFENPMKLWRDTDYCSWAERRTDE